MARGTRIVENVLGDLIETLKEQGMRAIASLVMSVLWVAIAFDAAGQQPAQKVTGDVVRYNAGVLEVRTASGAQQAIDVTDRTRLSVRAASDIAQVQNGRFIGVTAAPGADGTLVASEIHIFPENMRGTGEGHRPMTGANTMTNATVSGVSRAGASPSSMMNATVAAVAGANNEVKLTLTYHGGEKTIVVPHGIPVMTTDVGNPSMLVPGAHVIVYGANSLDGRLAAERISVGKDGYVPPI
jgi:hypothetical protein